MLKYQCTFGKMEHNLRAELFYNPRDLNANLKLALLFAIQDRPYEALNIYTFILTYAKDKYVRNLCYRNIYTLMNRVEKVCLSSTYHPYYIRFPVTITTCKRLELFRRTIASFFKHVDFNCIERVFVVDDGSSSEDIACMHSELGALDIEYKVIVKTAENKGHAKSMNLILGLVKEFVGPFFIHLEDDFEFFAEFPLIRTSAEVLMEDSKYGQCLFNNSYKESRDEFAKFPWGNERETASGTIYYEHLWPDPSSPHGYWPGFSLRPALNRIEMFLELGEFIEVGSFEQDYALRAAASGWKTTYLEAVYCEHIGRKTSDRADSSKANAYILNQSIQFDNFSYLTKSLRSYTDTIELKEEWSRFFLKDIRTLDADDAVEKLAHLKIWLELMDNYKVYQAFFIYNKDCQTIDWVNIYYKLNGFLLWDVIYVESGKNEALIATDNNLLETSVAYILHYRGARKLLSIVKEQGILEAFNCPLQAYNTQIDFHI